MTTLYKATETGVRFTSERRPGEVRIPNYVYDLWLPLLGATTIGVYSLYCRLERENVVKGLKLDEIASLCRIGKLALQRINDTLQECRFIRLVIPEGHKRLAHLTTEIVVLDPPSEVAKDIIDYCKPNGKYQTLTPWLVDAPEVLSKTSESSNKNDRTASSETANVAPSGSLNSVSYDTVANVASAPSQASLPDPITFKLTEVWKDGTTGVIKAQTAFGNVLQPPKESSAKESVPTPHFPTENDFAMNYRAANETANALAHAAGFIDQIGDAQPPDHIDGADKMVGYKPGDKVNYPYWTGYLHGERAFAAGIIVKVMKVKAEIVILNARTEAPEFKTVARASLEPRSMPCSQEKYLEAAYAQRTAPKPKAPRKADAVFDSLALLCYGTADISGMKSVGSAIGKAESEIKHAELNVTPERVQDFGEWWNRCDFRGQKGQRPEPHQIPGAWLKFMNGECQNGTQAAHAIAGSERTAGPDRSGGMAGQNAAPNGSAASLTDEERAILAASALRARERSMSRMRGPEGGDSGCANR